MTDSDQPKRLRRADCAAALRISGVEAWARYRTGNFALPAGTDGQGPYWRLEDLYRWAAATGESRLTQAAPVRCWPTAQQPAVYRGPRRLEGCVVQIWSVATGTMGVAWPLPNDLLRSRAPTPRCSLWSGTWTWPVAATACSTLIHAGAWEHRCRA